MLTNKSEQIPLLMAAELCVSIACDLIKAKELMDELQKLKSEKQLKTLKGILSKTLQDNKETLGDVTSGERNTEVDNETCNKVSEYMKENKENVPIQLLVVVLGALAHAMELSEEEGEEGETEPAAKKTRGKGGKATASGEVEGKASEITEEEGKTSKRGKKISSTKKKDTEESNANEEVKEVEMETGKEEGKAAGKCKH